MNNQFYVVLPSNSSMDVYPDNTVTCFTTKLPQEINLKGTWEVGLSEIQFPRSFLHLRKEDQNITIEHIPPLVTKDLPGNILLPQTKTFKVKIAYGMYSNINEFINFLNKVLSKTHINFILSGEKDNTYIVGQLTCNHSMCGYEHKVTMSRSILDILGFPEVKESFFIYDYIIGTRPADLLNSLPRQIFIYTDICEASIVGDVRASLLRIVPIKYKDFTYESTQYQTFTPINYIPLLRNCFRTIIIDIRDHLGQRVPFQSGTSNVTLHFRQVA